MDERPNITLVFHDAHMPVRDILRAVRAGLKNEFAFRYVSMRHGSADRADALVLRLRLERGSSSRDEALARPPLDAAGRRRAHCDLMEALQVANGIKAIDRALHEHWSDAHRDLYGEPASASSVKRWRAEAARNRDSLGGMRSHGAGRRRYAASEAVDRIRRRHASRVRASGMPVRQGYVLALSELERVNAGTHVQYGTPSSTIPPFSYETFRRDCSGVPDGRTRPTGSSGASRARRRKRVSPHR